MTLPGRGRRGGGRVGTGFSLLELMVVVTIMGVLIAIAAPAFRKAVEQARVDAAASHLRSIWAAQRLYYLDRRAYATSLETLADDGLLDLAPLAADRCFAYGVTQGGAAFEAAATRSTGGFSGSLVIDGSGVVSGSVVESSGRSYTPGFN